MPPPDDTLPTPPSAPPPADDRLAGRYRLGPEIARGGMGCVHPATDTLLRREVAIKVLMPNVAASAARRFLDEAGITAQLQHPGIPPVYDIGTLPDGRPFLAMKLIKGRTLDARLKDRTDADADRDELVAAFERVCEAVGYAHSRDVLHRDLKPSNVMIGAFGEVQVMDWGLAKLRAGGPPEELTDDSTPPVTIISALAGSDNSTKAGSVFGTPAYMPPEQAIGAVDKITARSDVFGLGGILCAILTGQPPYVGGSAESTRQLAAQAKLADAFRRLAECGADPELVALCKRCLAAEPDDRPTDGGAVAAEVVAVRHASEERVRQLELYRTATAVQTAAERKRRQGLLASAVLLASVLAVGGAVSTWQMIRAMHAERETAGQLVKTQQAEAAAVESAAAARAEADRATAQEAKATAAARQVKAVFQDFREVLAVLSPYDREAGHSPDRTVEALRKADVVSRLRLTEQPDLEADVRTTLGDLFADMGRPADARDQYARSLLLRERAFGPTDVRVFLSSTRLARAHLALGRPDLAEPIYRAALKWFQKTAGDTHPDTLAVLNDLAAVFREQQQYANAEEMYRHVLAARERDAGQHHPDTLATINDLAILLSRRGDFVEAESLYKFALNGREQVLGADHPDTVATGNNLAVLYRATGRPAAAVPLYQRALSENDKRLGREHPHTLTTVASLGNCCLDLDECAEACVLFKRLVVVYDRDGDSRVGLYRGLLGLALVGNRQHAAAEPLLTLFVERLYPAAGRLDPVNRNLLRRAVAALAEVCDRANRPAAAAEWQAVLAGLPPEVAPWPRPGRIQSR